MRDVFRGPSGTEPQTFMDLHPLSVGVRTSWDWWVTYNTQACPAGWGSKGTHSNLSGVSEVPVSIWGPL